MYVTMVFAFFGQNAETVQFFNEKPNFSLECPKKNQKTKFFGSLGKLAISPRLSENLVFFGFFGHSSKKLGFSLKNLTVSAFWQEIAKTIGGSNVLFPKPFLSFYNCAVSCLVCIYFHLALNMFTSFPVSKS